jgi:hypothetical protein
VATGSAGKAGDGGWVGWAIGGTVL